MSGFHKKRRILQKRTYLLSRRVKAYIRPFADKFKYASRRAKILLAACGVGLIGLIIFLATLNSGENDAIARSAVAFASPTTDAFIEIKVTPSPAPIPTPTPTIDPTLKRGDENIEVQKLQERLMQLGYLDLDESTQFFGPATKQAVQSFQRQVNFTEALGVTLAEDGVAGQETLSLLYRQDAPKYVVMVGMSGDDITNMQIQLKDLGYMKETTGYYGDVTKAAIADFQSRNRLDVDGLAGTQTYNMLYSPDARESATKVKQARTTANINEMIAMAKKKLGCSYVLGATGPNRFDCSGLVYYCLKEAGSNRRRLSAAGYSQVSDWEKITSINSLKKGDLIFFYSNNFSKVGHVGIVISSGMMIDASSSNGKVVKRSFSTSYWKRHFVCGRRPW